MLEIMPNDMKPFPEWWARGYRAKWRWRSSTIRWCALWASIVNVLKSSLCVTKWSAISPLCFPMEEKRGSALFLERCLLFKNIRAVALLAAVLAAVPATVLYFDVPRRSVGGDLQLSGVVKLLESRNWSVAVLQHEVLQTCCLVFQLPVYARSVSVLCSVVSAACDQLQLLRDGWNLRDKLSATFSEWQQRNWSFMSDGDKRWRATLTKSR